MACDTQPANKVLVEVIPIKYRILPIDLRKVQVRQFLNSCSGRQLSCKCPECVCGTHIRLTRYGREGAEMDFIIEKLGSFSLDAS